VNAAHFELFAKTAKMPKFLTTVNNCQQLFKDTKLLKTFLTFFKTANKCQKTANKNCQQLPTTANNCQQQPTTTNN